MTMPRVSEEVLHSIRDQIVKNDHVDTKYLTGIVEQVFEENPHLGQFIANSAILISSLENPDSIRWLSTSLMLSIYQSIKQQLIVDELNGVS